MDHGIDEEENDMSDDQFIEIVGPSDAAGISFALKNAFAESDNLPVELRMCLAQLDRI